MYVVNQKVGRFRTMCRIVFCFYFRFEVYKSVSFLSFRLLSVICNGCLNERGHLCRESRFVSEVLEVFKMISSFPKACVLVILCFSQVKVRKVQQFFTIRDVNNLRAGFTG